MLDTPKPRKQKVREYLERRTHAEEAPPTREEIRRQIGWDMIPENKRPGQVDDD